MEATCGVAGYTGDTYCKACDTKIVEGEVTNATGGHAGGTATCKTKAVCATCGESYGNLNSENHEGETELRDAKEATSSEAGYTGDTYCKACNTKIADGTVIDATGDNTDIMTTVSLLDSIKGFINNNGSLTRPGVSGGAAVFATSEGNAANQLLCQFANAAENVKSFEISTTVTAGTGRRGVGFKTPSGYLFFNVTKEGSANGAGYVWYNTDYEQQTQDYVALSTAAEAVVAGAEVYTLKIAAENLTGTSSDTITLYVNDIAVYTYTNTLGWDLTAKVLPAIGVRGGGASATFTDYTFKVQYEE